MFWHAICEIFYEIHWKVVWKAYWDEIQPSDPKDV